MNAGQGHFSESRPQVEKDQGFGFYISILGRRWPYFLIPFVVVLSVGAMLTMLMKPIYRSEARILVQTQQIPSDLVRPTVTATAEERIQVIAQRIMTRDNLLAIVNKFGMFPTWRPRVTESDLVEIMRERASVTPIALNITGSRGSTLAFTVAFEYEEPQTTTRVANEFVTLILNEDVRARTSRASETTKFLSQEVGRLEKERLEIEVQIARQRFTNIAPQETASQLAVLKAELFQKSAVYSASHPEIRALKERIAALEAVGKELPPQGNNAPPPEAAAQSPTTNDSLGSAPTNTTLGMLEAKAKSIQADLDGAREKLLTARQGQRLEEDQQSERFEVIEQPSLPQEPVKPNRKKMLALAFALAVAFGFGGVFAIEAYDKTIRGTADMPVASQFVVSIPYIATSAEMWRAKRRLKQLAIAGAILFLILLAGTHFLVMPLDLVVEKVTSRLVGI